MEFTGKTVEEALKIALNELNATEDNVNVTVKEQPKKGIFGLLKGKAVIDVEVKTAKESNLKENKAKANKESGVKPEKKQKKVKEDFSNDLSRAKEFLAKVIELLGQQATITIGNDGENDALIIESEDSSAIIGYRGEVLDALQTMAGAVANIGHDEYKKVVVDCESYRNRREDTLKNLAHKLEEKATEMRRDVWLEPMSPFERRIIHTALADSKTVTTKSEGKEPNRFVVIVPNERDEYAKPYNAGRNEHSKNDRNGKKPYGKKGNFKGNKNGSYNKPRVSSSKKSTSFTFGTFLGNSNDQNK